VKQFVTETQRLEAVFMIRDPYGMPFHIQLWSDDNSEFAKLLRTFLRQGLRLQDKLELLYISGWDIPQ
jgi:hypothetical protein